MAVTSGSNSHNKIVSDLLESIDNCMDLLVKQLNKNPNTRQSNYHNHEQKSSDSSHSKRFPKNNKRSRKKRRKMDPSVYMSKRLSFYLRHGAEKVGLKIRNDGYVRVNDILKLKEFKDLDATFGVIKTIVDTNDKQRFGMMEENHIWYIRANQGHSIKSIKSKELLSEITLNDMDKYPVVCHGTYTKVWDVVRKEGLKTMSRNHIHMVPSDACQGKGVISGMRYNCQILIYIDLEYALKDGIQFFLSQNNVILSSGLNGQLPPKYFKKVTTFEKGKPGKVLWQNDKLKNDDGNHNQNSNSNLRDGLFGKKMY
eukprot:699115_1